jgi:hypothetical protein
MAYAQQNTAKLTVVNTSKVGDPTGRRSRSE